MATATVTSKGQITIPASVRAKLQLSAGTRVEFVEFKEGQFALVAAKSPVSALRGILRKPRKPVSIRDMDRAIMREVSKGY